MLRFELNGEKYAIFWRHEQYKSKTGEPEVRDQTGKVVEPKLKDGTPRKHAYRGETMCLCVQDNGKDPVTKQTVIAGGTSRCHVSDSFDREEGRKHALAAMFRNNKEMFPPKKSLRRELWDSFLGSCAHRTGMRVVRTVDISKEISAVNSSIGVRRFTVSLTSQVGPNTLPDPVAVITWGR